MGAGFTVEPAKLPLVSLDREIRVQTTIAYTL
jgi:hypothetical protein